MRHFSVYQEFLERADAITKDVVRYAPAPNADPTGFRANLAGLLCTAYVAAFECSTKEILISFARRTHAVLGNFVGHNMDRINGRIKIENLAKDYIRPFGQRYEDKFKQLIKQEEESILKIERMSVRSSYDNIISWRNDFAHSGNLLASLEETSLAFPIAKRIIFQVDAAMSI